MNRTALLAGIPAFATLADDDLGALGRRLDEASFHPGDVIVSEGDVQSTSLFIIEDGLVEISHGKDKGRVTLATMSAGQYFGELALIDGSPRSATAVATSPVRALVLERQDFVDFVRHDPDAGLRVMADLAGRLRHTNDLVSAAYEDMQRMGGMEALDGAYRQTPVWQMIRKRGGWLCALFLGEMLTASAMGHFASEIERAVVLALFVPLIISSGGNSGSQGTSLIIRALALNDLALRDWVWVLGREVFSGLILGVLLGAVGFTRIVVWQSFGWTDYGPHYLAIAFTIWASLIGVVGFGATAGSMLPFGLRRIGFDPATSSAPFVATLVDVTGLIIYFTIASVILRGLVL